jgi:transcriptional regulator with XRE-family HTH domain
MALLNTSQSGLARAVRVDRSTISALLAEGTRLPNAQLIADIAQALGVTTDWLLGLAARPTPAETLLEQAVEFNDAPRALFSNLIISWHKEAAGYKVRHVPATLPDMLKLPEVVSWEYRDHLVDEGQAAVALFQAHLDWMKTARSDYEIAIPIHELQSFATGTGYWLGLPWSVRKKQLRHLIDLSKAMYPSLRLCGFDAHKVYSSPTTIFGPNLGVIYLGRSYVSFRDPTKVHMVIQHFDWLIREASVGAREMADFLENLLSAEEISSAAD